MDYLPVTADVRWQSRKRRASFTQKPAQPIERYSKVDFAALQRAARTATKLAHRRITTAYAEALHGSTPSATVKQKALWQVLNLGEPQSTEGWRALEALEGKAKYKQQARWYLFPTSDESVAASVLIACRSGMNWSAVASMKVPTLMAHTIAQSDTEKPRRGARNRFWPDIVDDWGESKGAASALRMIAELTEPLREHLRLRGDPTDRLLLRWEHSGSPLLGPAQIANPGWLPQMDGGVRFRRIRRSVGLGGVAKEPTHHSPSTHLHYVRTDAEALIEHQLSAAAGIQDALNRARAELTMRRADIPASARPNDALIAHCVEPERSPVTGLPCTTGYFSFLDCLDCENAVTVERLLPRQMAALEVMQQLHDAIGESWDELYRKRVLMLRALVERSTQAERDHASSQVARFRPLIVAALRHEIPEDYDQILG
ncbi:hypothetical protein [Plantibacter sp. M259]|uniref:hypothetical protein n=1 Tax=Plantibacter sp. M259 TaxID=2583822 RepID=UPI0011107AB0|nr:hypothetical protein [Plantibacter sp. M259]